MIMNNEHVDLQIADYVLGLLPPPAKQALERHTAVCPQCRAALHKEQTMSHMVRATLHTASQPPTAVALRRLMPVPPVRSTWSLTWQRTLAPVGILILMLVGSLGFRYGGSPTAVWSTPFPTHIAITATNEPTSTVAGITQTATAETATATQTAVQPYQTPIPTPMALSAPTLSSPTTSAPAYNSN